MRRAGWGSGPTAELLYTARRQQSGLQNSEKWAVLPQHVGETHLFPELPYAAKFLCFPSLLPTFERLLIGEMAKEHLGDGWRS